MNSPSQSYQKHPALGNYHLLEELGRGGMGTVYHAVHCNLKKHVALKKMTAELADDPSSVKRFYREMEAVGQLNDLHLVSAHDAGEVDGVHYLVMELLEGIDLSQLVMKLGPLTPSHAAEVIRQAALGLQTIEQHGMIHRDLKVSNLFLTNEGIVKILDLGLARSQYAHQEELTPTGLGMGTVDYMAPEQARNAKEADIRADIYSLGCTLFKLLTGRPPYDKPEFSSVPEKILAHCHEPVPELPKLKSEIPAGLQKVLQRMMAKDLSERYQHPGEVVDAIKLFTHEANLKSLAECAAVEQGKSISLDGTSQSLINANIDTVPFPPKPAPSKIVTAEDSISSTDHSLPTVNKKRLRLVATIVVALSMILGGAWLGFNALKSGDKVQNVTPILSPLHSLVKTDDTTPKPPVIPMNSLDDAEPFHWTSLLGTEPKALFSFDKYGTNNLTYDPKKKQLIVSTSDQCFIPLGETNSSNYQFQVGLRQFKWSSGPGIFFGLHATKNQEGKVIWKFQGFSLHRDKNRRNREEFRLNRFSGWSIPNPESANDVHISAIANERIPHHLFGEQSLSIEIMNGRLTSVKIDGTPLPQLAEGPMNDRFSPIDYQGKLGLMTSGCSAIFQNARYKKLK